ncbi:MAG: hypothetical protein JWR88_1940 [Pseudonocardia sp.]|jgi:hypothetical protein|nr:hypothetical protein [Pseudonocardia sp.]
MNAVTVTTAEWNQVGTEMGYSDTPAKRQAITAAADAIDWTDQPYTLPRLSVAPLRVLVAAIFHGRLGQLHRAGSVTLVLDGQQHALVGLEDAANRYYLLDLGHEAVYVRHETRHTEQLPDPLGEDEPRPWHSPTCQPITAHRSTDARS